MIQTLYRYNNLIYEAKIVYHKIFMQIGDGRAEVPVLVSSGTAHMKG